MTRISSALYLDWRLQWRNGFYYAAIVMVAVQIAVFSLLPANLLETLLPVILIGNLTINGFYFVAGLILLEKAEGSLEAVILSPLRSTEYLASKALTLCALSVIESLVICIALRGVDFSPLPLMLGVCLSTALLCQFGFLVVARYDSINEFLFPSFAWTTLLAIPYLDYFDIWHSPLMYLHPVQALLAPLKAAVSPVPAGHLAYGIVWSAVWTAGLYWLAVRAFQRFVVRQARA